MDMKIGDLVGAVCRRELQTITISSCDRSFCLADQELESEKTKFAKFAEHEICNCHIYI